MDKLKTLTLCKGAILYVPGVKKILRRNTGGTNESRYCYSVWMRHLKNWNSVYSHLPEIVAEIGPGDSLGTGFAALLSGCKKIYACDVIKYWDTKINLKIFNELVELFVNMSNIPNNKEYPEIKPQINSYDFPFDIISKAYLKKALAKNRLESIRNEINDIENPNNQFIICHSSWNNSDLMKNEVVDFVYSQAVLEHVEDLDSTYKAMRDLLKPKGLMSHRIDLKSHGLTKYWNGHWTFSDFEWKIAKGGKSFLINRQPYSFHIHLHHKYKFKILKSFMDKMECEILRKQLSKRFKSLTWEELTTSGLYILSQKM